MFTAQRMLQNYGSVDICQTTLLGGGAGGSEFKFKQNLTFSPLHSFYNLELL